MIEIMSIIFSDPFYFYARKASIPMNAGLFMLITRVFFVSPGLLLRGHVTIDIGLDRIRPDPVTALVGMEKIAHDFGADGAIRLEKLVA